MTDYKYALVIIKGIKAPFICRYTDMDINGWNLESYDSNSNSWIPLRYDRFLDKDNFEYYDLPEEAVTEHILIQNLKK